MPSTSWIADTSTSIGSSLHEAGSFCVIRAKTNLKAERRYSLRSTEAPASSATRPSRSPASTRTGFPAPLRRIGFKDPETGKRLVFLSNNFALPALTITKLYRLRWQIELFFKWIKQHLRIKAFFGTTENAVKTQIWIAVSVYVLVAIVKKRLQLSASLYEILQILSLTMFERMPIDQLLSPCSRCRDRARFPQPIDFVRLTLGHFRVHHMNFDMI